LLATAAQLLKRAERPLIYAGGGVLAGRATDELRELAERLQAPVVMSANGRGALDSRHPLALSSLAGRDLLATADAVLVVGSRFLQVMGAQVKVAADASVILLNAEERDLGEPRSAKVAIHGDAALGLSGITSCLGDLPGRKAPAAIEAARAHAQDQIEEIVPQRHWVDALRAGITEDGILVNGLTQVGYLATVAYPVYGPNTYLTPGYQGTLGYAFATALGAKVANPDRMVVAICGDGGFGWNMQELATARKYNIGVVTVVFNDAAYGNVRRIQKVQFDGRYVGSDLVNPDFTRLAEAFGVAATRVTTPEELRAVLVDARSITGPLLVEVPVGPMPSPWHLMVDHIKKQA
jgi:acetolactate synthase-1/2/3 large subunit